MIELKCMKNHTLVLRRGSAYIRGFAEEKGRMRNKISSEFVLKYTRVYVNGSAYIRDIRERKAHMQTRVLLK